MRRLRHLALALLVPVVACASGARSGGAAPSRVDRNRISEVEIEDARARNVRDAYDLVRSLRPQWMRAVGSGFGGAAGQVVVFVDNTRAGGVDYLRQVTLAGVRYIRWIGPSEAAGMFGLDVNYGAIQVVTISGR